MNHAQFLSTFKTSQNHLLRESNGLATASVYFPEFKPSKHWLQIALTRLNAELEKQINPDGFHFELSTGYQWVVVNEFEKTLLDELDLMREAASASQLRRNFIDSDVYGRTRQSPAI